VKERKKERKKEEEGEQGEEKKELPMPFNHAPLYCIERPYPRL
jgi:hypothetical protein